MNGMSVFRRGMVLALAVLMAFVAIGPLPAAQATKGPPQIIPPTDKYRGHTYQEWSNIWWQWAYSNPITRGQEELNPLYDTTGASCGAGQKGSVWFLAGIYTITDAAGAVKQAQEPVVRTDCVISAGKALFIPILNTEADAAQYPDYTLQQLRDSVADSMAAIADLELVIDGQVVPNIREYVIGPNNRPVAFTFPKNNMYQYWGMNVPAGTYYPMVTDGYYVMLEPLSKGEHTIEIYGTAPIWDFVLDVHYDPLTVK